MGYSACAMALRGDHRCAAFDAQICGRAGLWLPDRDNAFSDAASASSLLSRFLAHAAAQEKVEFYSLAQNYYLKIPAPIKIKSALPPPPPPKRPKIPPLKRGILWKKWFFPAERTHFFEASIKLARPFPAPESRTRILWTRGFCTENYYLRKIILK